MSKWVLSDLLSSCFLTRQQNWCMSMFTLHVKTRQHTHQTHINKHWTPTLIQKSLNMYLLLITLEINSSGRALTGARCYWQTAVAVTDNMRYLSILHCNPPIRLSLSLPLLFPSCVPRSLVLPLQAQLSFLLQSGELRNDTRTKTSVTATIHWN